MSDATTAIDAALYAKLSGDATLAALLASATAVYADQAPPAAVFPLVIFSQAAPGVDAYTLQSRAFETHRYLVKGVVQGDDQLAAGAISARIDALLTDQPVTLGGGWTLMACRRSQTVKYTQTDAGSVYRYAGGVYVLEVL